LLAESVGLVFAVREPSEARELRGLPELMVGGLGDDDARALLASALPGRLDERVRDRLVAESRGNPLALLEVPRGFTPAELAGGFGLPDVTPLPNLIEQSFRRRLEPLPTETRRLLLTAAAEPVGDAALVWRAAEGRGGGQRARTLGRPRTSSRWCRGGGGVPAARDRAHPRPCAPWGAGASRCTRQAGRRRGRCGRGSAGNRGAGPARRPPERATRTAARTDRVRAPPRQRR